MIYDLKDWDLMVTMKEQEVIDQEWLHGNRILVSHKMETRIVKVTFIRSAAYSFFQKYNGETIVKLPSDMTTKLTKLLFSKDKTLHNMAKEIILNYIKKHDVSTGDNT